MERINKWGDEINYSMSGYEIGIISSDDDDDNNNQSKLIKKYGESRFCGFWQHR
jgi:hypothetical protein